MVLTVVQVMEPGTCDVRMVRAWRVIGRLSL